MENPARLAAETANFNADSTGASEDVEVEADENPDDTGDSEEEEEIDPSVQPLQYAYDDMVKKCLNDNAFWKKVRVAGYSAQSYTYNLNRPDDRINSFRAYDRIHNAYLFNVFQLSAYADSTTESRVGFGIKGNAGRDTEVFVPFNEPTTDRVDLYEAWISYLVRDDVLVKAGKMPTLAGFEVADEKDNYNISRGLLWSYLQPVTHTGFRGTYTSPDELYNVTLGVSRGWDIFRRDNNDALSYEAQMGFTPNDKLAYAVTYLVGPEAMDNSGDLRHLIDVVATYKATDKLTYGLNYDFRFDENATTNHGTADSQGLAGYVKYELNEKASVAARLEGVRDQGKAATGVRQAIGDATITAQYKFRENLWGRLELRHDQSNRSVFSKGSDSSHGQNRIAASVLITF